VLRLLFLQLLDEVNDGGIVFNMEPNILREMITPPSLFSMLQDKVMGPGQNVASVLPGGSLTNVYWRRANARYTTNEIYFDLIESINAVVDRNGAMVSSEVVGEAQVNCKLSGMPDLILKFTNSGIMDDVALHPCVRYARWEREKLLSFIPPDGEFKLFDYRVIGNIQLPLYVKPNIMFTDVGGRVQVVVGSKYNTADKPVEECVIIIPFSKNTTSATLSANAGTVTFDDMTKVCRWSLGRLKSGATPQLEGTVNHAPGTPKPDSSPTILVEFKVTMWAASGLKVDTLTVRF
jgi:AP-3 complex subunit mu